MKNLYESAKFRSLFGNKGPLQRLCAVVLAMAVFLSALPTALGEAYFETNLSMYYADATMGEGKASKKAEEFFSSIASIATLDLKDPNFFTRLGEAVDGGYKYRVFVMHEKGMPETDLAMLYCFEDSSWLLKDMTRVPGSVYADVSWQVLQGLDLKMKQKELLKKTKLNIDASYECDPETVWQIFVQFTLFVEERNKALQQIMDDAVDYIPALPEEIDSWPLDIPISVQLPAELPILEAWFTAEPAGSASATFDAVSESNRYKGTVDENNLVSATIRVWEAGPHLIRLMVTADINGQKTSMAREISIDTSEVILAEEETCPMFADGHHWKYVWAKEHPHYGHFECDCGAEKEDPVHATKEMFDCCECVGHDWKLAYFVSSVNGKGYAVGKCRRCGICIDMTDKMPAYITDYLKLLEKNGAEGNTYFEEHRTGNALYTGFTPSWVYIANQSLSRYTDPLVTYRESFMNTLAEPFVSLIELCDKEYEKKINIYSKAQLYWIRLIQETINEEYMEESYEYRETVIDSLDIGVDLMNEAYESQTEWLIKVENETFDRQVAQLTEKLQGARLTLDNVKITSENSAEIAAAQRNTDNALKELKDLKAKGADHSLSSHKVGKAINSTLPYLMNAISALLEGCEAGDKMEEMRSAYIQMLNDYDRSGRILEAMRKDAEARQNTQLVHAIDNISDVLDATFTANLGQYFDTTTKIVDSIGNELGTAGEEAFTTFTISFMKKSAQTFIMSLASDLIKGTNPIGIASLAAKILKGVSNYDEIFDKSLDLISLNCIRSDNSLSLLENEEQVSPYTLALYAKVESQGCEKAADLVSTMKPAKDISDAMDQILMCNTMPGIGMAMMLTDAMDVNADEFGIGKNEKDTVERMLLKERDSYEEYIRKCLRDAEEQ